MAASDVLVASPVTGTGGILSAPLGTTPALPTDTTTATTGFSPLGYVGEDGVTMSENRSVEKIRAWGGDTVRVVQNEHDVTFSLSLLETTEVTMKELHGDGAVSATAATETAGNLLAVQIKSDPLPHKKYVIDIKDGDKRVRIVIPDGQITEVGDTQFVHTTATAHELTIEAFPDEDGVKAYIYSDDGQKAA